MLLIQDILVSELLIKETFVCHLEKCKGACCWKGDYGAPLEEDEAAILDEIFPRIRTYMDADAVTLVEDEGTHKMYHAKRDFEGTALRDNGACVFMRTRPDGIAECGIEAAYKDGVTDFRKPVSCHLYPVRVSKVPELDFEALNYDEWDICSPACSLGKSLKIPLYQFVKDAIVRKYGDAFYQELDAVARDMAAE